jgi:phosphatidylethanolamine/phosphatidyl-N-methylethanolamine N-methyltransferase
MSTEPDDVEFWRVQARRYDRAIDVLNRRFGEMTRHVAAALDGCGDVVEIAAGTGLVTEHIAAVVERLVATDRSPQMLEILRGRVRAAGASNVEVREADALALPFDDGSFDAVVMANLLHLLPDPKLALAEARRVLRPDGLLCAPTFCHGEHALARAVSGVLALARFPVVTRFSADSLVTTIDNAGFRVVDTRTYRGLLPLCLVVARLP